MMNTKIGCLGLSLCASLSLLAQKEKVTYRFDQAIVVDSASTLLLPMRQDGDLLSGGKLMLGNEGYSNIVFYNFVTDSYQRLFVDDVQILSVRGNNLLKSARNKRLFYLVKDKDFNRNTRIDTKDPSILYVSDLQGKNLKALTTENEHVLQVDMYDAQGFALLHIQLDADNDGSYESEDKSFYCVKLDLSTLTLGKPIEAK